MTDRRAVITGLGLVTPLANGVEASWSRLISGESGAGPITRFDASDISCRVACEVPLGDGSGHSFNAADVLPPRGQRRIDTFILFALAAADEAVADAGIATDDAGEQARIGVLIGSGIGGLPRIEETVLSLRERGPRMVSPFFIPASLINLASGNIAMRHGFRGPNHGVVTACSSGAHAIGDAAELIRRGAADVMVAGGAEAAICRTGIAGFAACRALSTGFNDEPERASRPWDRRRDGFVMGEGAGVVIVEELERARRRGATILAEIAGYGMSGDAHHVTAPSPDGDGARRAMEAALASAELAPSGIDYVNAHGTSTPAGDEIEIAAMKAAFGGNVGNLAVSSTKSSIGHLLGAAGAVEAVFSVLAIRDGVVPPTLNLEEPDQDFEINLVPFKAQRRPVQAALSNSFGFGGTNASLVLTAPPD